MRKIDLTVLATDTVCLTGLLLLKGLIGFAVRQNCIVFFKINVFDYDEFFGKYLVRNLIKTVRKPHRKSIILLKIISIC